MVSIPLQVSLTDHKLSHSFNNIEEKILKNCGGAKFNWGGD